MPDAARILSDVHFGDRASRVARLTQLRPLLDGAATLILNGDTLDTRRGADPGLTAGLRAEVREFFHLETPGVTFLTGNHDPDISDGHALDLAGGRVFVTHGDVLFDTIVPWSRDAPLIARLLAEESAASAPDHDLDLAARLARWRKVAARIPQRHQSESNPFKYAVRFAGDTIWPPLRVLRILRAWRDTPPLAAALLRRYRPLARFILVGHTHRPGWWRMPDGLVVINTGSFCPPFGGNVVDLSQDRLTVRRVVVRGGEFRAAGVVAEFSLAEG